MPSTDLYGSVIAFLEDSGNTPGDLRATVNAEIASLLVAGSVTTARSGRGGQRNPRRDPFHEAAVEIVPMPQPKPRYVGIGVQERDAVFEIKFTWRQKDQMQGKAQFQKAKDVARALLQRYEGCSDLAITILPGGGTASFRHSSAEVLEFDEIPDSSELVRSVVRLTFTFTEVMVANE